MATVDGAGSTERLMRSLGPSIPFLAAGPVRSDGPVASSAVAIPVVARSPRWLAALLLAGCSVETDRRIGDGIAEEKTDAEFYALPDPVPTGKPGTIERIETLPSAPAGSKAWRVLYHTTDLSGADRIVSASIIAPDSPAPAGGRPVVGWAHPTTGAVARCAPSNGIDPFDLIEGMTELLHAGYVVAAADYPGMGVEGQSSYLVGVTEANSVLDSIRAARNLPDTGAGTDVILWGHSQGGQAALFAGQQIKSYAPELTLRAVGVLAPATELVTLLDDHISDASGVTIGSLAFAAYVDVYQRPLSGAGAGLGPHPGRRRRHARHVAAVPARPVSRPAQDRRPADRQVHRERSGHHRAVGDAAKENTPGRLADRRAVLRRARGVRRTGQAGRDDELRHRRPVPPASTWSTSSTRRPPMARSRSMPRRMRSPSSPPCSPGRRPPHLLTPAGRPTPGARL